MFSVEGRAGKKAQALISNLSPVCLHDRDSLADGQEVCLCENGRTKRDEVSHQAMSKPRSFRVGPEAAEYSSCIKRKQWTDGLGYNRRLL